MVEGSAVSSGNEWTFQEPVLTCDVPPLISAWLRDLATWADASGGEPSPGVPWLIEPNLGFGPVAMDDGRVVLTIELDLEFLPPERLKGRNGAGNPEVLTVRATTDELRRAADGFDRTIACYPDCSPQVPRGD